MFTALGRVMYRWRVPVLVLWTAAIVGGGIIGGQIFDRASSVESLSPDAESVRTELLLDERLGDGPEMVAVARGRHPRDPELIESLVDVADELHAIDGVVEVRDGYTAPGGLIGADNNSVAIWVELGFDVPEADRERLEEEVAAVLHTIDAPTVLVSGEELAERAFADQAIRDAAVGESIAMVALLATLIVILGGVLAAMLPLLVALGAIAAAFLGLVGLTALTPVSEFAVNVVTLLGIGLAVDYTIVLIFRFREERAADPAADPSEWICRTMATAGRAVLISGLAVASAMVGLSVFAEPLLASIAQGGAIVALLATAVALTAAPALLGVSHRRVPAVGAATWVRRIVWRVRRAMSRRPPRAADGGMLARLAAHAQRRPWPVAAVAAGGLLVLALPVLTINLGNSDARSLPTSMEARQAYDVMQRDFLADRAAPVVVVIDADPAEPAVRDLLNELLVLPQVHQLQIRFDLPPGITVVDLTPLGETGGPESRELVREIRAMSSPLRVSVGGSAAEVVDHADSLGGRLPVVIGVLLVATMALLFVLTGSVVIPVKAVMLNLLTLLATLGVLVMVFQRGVGAPLFGFDSWGAMDITTPVFLLVFIYGLTMDYEVFMLSRIKEEHDRGAGSHAVLRGIVRSGPVVTAAAICMIIVFLGFVLGELVAVKEVGLGMAVAIALDVTVIRGLLLPAVMALLGEWNWWAPGPLRRLHTRWLTTTQPAVEPAP
jgi:RND superfamily putative drug exporter